MIFPRYLSVGRGDPARPCGTSSEKGEYHPMEKTAVQKLAGVLKILVTITFVCNLIALLLVPGMVMLRHAWPMYGGPTSAIMDVFPAI